MIEMGDFRSKIAKKKHPSLLEENRLQEKKNIILYLNNFLKINSHFLYFNNI